MKRVHTPTLTPSDIRHLPVEGSGMFRGGDVAHLGAIASAGVQDAPRSPDGVRRGADIVLSIGEGSCLQ